MRKILYTLVFHVFTANIAMDIQPNPNTQESPEEIAAINNAAIALAQLQKSVLSQPLQSIVVDRLQMLCPVCKKLFYSNVGIQALKDNLCAHIKNKHKKEFDLHQPDFKDKFEKMKLLSLKK